MDNEKLNVLYSNILVISDRITYAQNVHELRSRCDDLLATLIEIDTELGDRSQVKAQITDLVERIAAMKPYYS